MRARSFRGCALFSLTWTLQSILRIVFLIRGVTLPCFCSQSDIIVPTSLFVRRPLFQEKVLVPSTPLFFCLWFVWICKHTCTVVTCVVLLSLFALAPDYKAQLWLHDSIFATCQYTVPSSWLWNRLELIMLA